MGRIRTTVDAWQRRHAPAAVVVGVLRKFRDDRGASLAALVTYYAFFSVFPLLLVFVSTLGFLLEDDPTLRDKVVSSTLGRIPVLGPQLDDKVQPLSGSRIALAAGLLTALWAGLGVMLALARAFDTIWDVPRVEQRGAIAARLRGTVVLVVLAVGLVVTTAATGSAVTGHLGAGAQRVVTVAGSVVLNALVFGVAFRVLGAHPLRVAEILPGAALAAVGALALQLAGTWYVDRAVDRASDTYGAFAVVIGLLSWFLLGSNLLILSAELNVVLHRRLWPRSLAGELAPADRAAMRVSARAARRDAREEIAVRFDDEADGSPARLARAGDDRAPDPA
jgi:membrane protein